MQSSNELAKLSDKKYPLLQYQAIFVWETPQEYRLYFLSQLQTDSNLTQYSTELFSRNCYK